MIDFGQAVKFLNNYPFFKNFKKNTQDIKFNKYTLKNLVTVIAF